MNLCIDVYIYIYAHMYIYMHIHININYFLHIYAHTVIYNAHVHFFCQKMHPSAHSHKHAYGTLIFAAIYAYMSVYVRMNEFACVNMYVCYVKISLYTCMFMYVRTHTWSNLSRGTTELRETHKYTLNGKYDHLNHACACKRSVRLSFFFSHYCVQEIVGWDRGFAIHTHTHTHVTWTSICMFVCAYIYM